MAYTSPTGPIARQTSYDYHGADRCPAVWVYCNASGVWCVRKEGAPREYMFESSMDAMSFARAELARATSYRLFVVRRDGRVTEEMLNPACHSV